MHFLPTILALAATTSLSTASPLSINTTTTTTSTTTTTPTNSTLVKRWSEPWIGSHLAPNCDKHLPLPPGHGHHDAGTQENGYILEPRPKLHNPPNPSDGCVEFKPKTDWIGWSWGSGNPAVLHINLYKNIEDCRKNWYAPAAPALGYNGQDGGCAKSADYPWLGAVSAYN